MNALSSSAPIVVTTPVQTGIEVAAPVRTVVLLEDRAQVTRRVEVELPAGPSRLRIAAVTPLAADRTLMAHAAAGLRVDELKVRRRWRIGAVEQPPDAAALTREAVRLEGEITDREERLQVAQQRRALLLQSAKLLVDSVNKELPYAGGFEPRWEKDLEEAYRRLREQDTERNGSQRQIEALQRELDAVQMRQGMSHRPSEIFEAELQLDLTADKAGRYAFDLEYTVPCALWRPIHRASLLGEELRFECEAAVWQNTGEDWTDVELRFSTARSTQRAEPPLLEDEWLQPQRRQEKKVTVQVRDQAIATTGEGTASGGLPGVDDGGETRLLDAATRTTVVSDGRMRRIPVFQFTAPAQVDRIACPELEPLVHLRVRGANAGKHPILAGPVDLLRSSGYVGRSQVGFVAPGEKLALGFGSEDGVRVRRESWASEERAKLTGKLTITRRVSLFLSNLDDSPAAFVVQERVPVSEIDKVKIEVDVKETKPAPVVDEQGIATWKVVVAPHGTDRISLVYQVSASSDVQGLSGSV
ncbi:MAG: DUF4139 domain-containing protein [Deltaproteobacteria bacterium]|nr:DUF4139 domain-containing protein [Deltaproteobacteria bacterium]